MPETFLTWERTRYPNPESPDNSKKGPKGPTLRHVIIFKS